jgi:hypothetical protein
MLIRILMLFAAANALSAQWLDRKTPGVPRGANGRVNLSAPAPQRDGKPDISGIWQADNLTWLQDVSQHVAGGVPLQPWAAELVKQRAGGARGEEESDAHCLPQGVPKINATPVPFKIIPTPDSTVILYEAFGQYRQIYTDGRGLPATTNPIWLGYSVGRWEGNTFVVETIGFNGKTWIDSAGHPTSESTKVTERFLRKDFGHLEIGITIDDPKAYTKPWSYTAKFTYQADTDVLEFVCLENERDLVHLNTK